MCVDVSVVYLAVRWVSGGMAHSQSSFSLSSRLVAEGKTKFE